MLEAVRAGYLVNRAADRLEMQGDPEGALEIVGRALALVDAPGGSGLAALNAGRAHQVAAESYLQLDRPDDAIDSYAKAERGFATSPRFAEHYVRLTHDAAISLANLGMEDLAYSYASKGADIAAGLGGDYHRDLERLKLSLRETGPDEHGAHLRQLRSALAGASDQREVRALRHRIAAWMCEFGGADEVQQAFAEIEGLYSEAETLEQQIITLGPLGHLWRERHEFPAPLFDACAYVASELSPQMESTLQADAHGVHAVALWSRGEVKEALIAGLEAVAMHTAHAWRIGSSTVRLLTGERAGSARHLALRFACELDEAELVAELIESARLAALPDPDAEPRVVSLLRPGEPTEVAQRRLGPLHPITVRGRSWLAGCYPVAIPTAPPIELDEIIDAIGGDRSCWWGAWMGADDFRFWATRNGDGEYACGYGEEGKELVRAALKMCPVFGTRESVRTGAFTVGHAAEEELSGSLGALLVPSSLRRELDPGRSASSAQPPISLVVSSNFLSALPAALLGLGRDEAGSLVRLVERATLRTAPPAALVADLGRVEARSLPYRLSVACIDATDELDLSDLRVSPERLLGGRKLCADDPEAELASLANLSEALRGVGDSRSVFAYFGHAEEGEVGADLASFIPLADGRLSAEDIFVGRDAEGAPIRFPERVLLSACGSAGSTGAGSGEWLGLTAGMLRRGAREVLATAWPIWNLPLTKALDVALLAALESGDDVAAELRGIQLACLAAWREADDGGTPIEPHGDSTIPFPLIWAAYQYVGVPAAA